MKSNNMAASMDVNVQMDKYLVHNVSSSNAMNSQSNQLQQPQYTSNHMTRLQSNQQPNNSILYHQSPQSRSQEFNNQSHQFSSSYNDSGGLQTSQHTISNMIGSDAPKMTKEKMGTRNNALIAAALANPPPRKRRGRPPADPNHHAYKNAIEDDAPTLFGAIRSGISSPQNIVDGWIEQYKTNSDAAMLELIQFFISCSGCKGKVTMWMYQNLSEADIIRKMTDEFDEDSGEYPLSQTSSQWRRFKSNFVEFIQVLVRQCQYSIIYDECMIEKMMSMLTGLSDSQVRAFRHTSTLAAMKMMTALVDVALNLSINADNNQRQFEAERSKSQHTRGAEKLKFLSEKKQELVENRDEVKAMLVFLFKGVFVHRYRDNQSEIRALCMHEIGVWMQRYPTVFLDDSYLKYVGWTLYDRVGDVRIQCLRALQPLYEDNELVSRLELFTSRFKARLVDMTLDKESDVAVQAVKLVSFILRNSENVLEDKDCENIYELVYCTHRPLAQAAGEFLTLKLFDVSSRPDTQQLQRTQKGKKRSVNTPLLRDLLHEHAAYLVDSLWDTAPMLRDWEAMVDLLIEEPGKHESHLDANQESSLIEILVCCVKQAVTGVSPVGRQSGTHHHANPLNDFNSRLCHGYATNLTAKEMRLLAEEKTRMTNAMIPALPNLLTKFSESSERAANLLQIPQYMDFEIYTNGRHERHLDLLLRCMQDIVDRHTDPDTLLAVSKVYSVMCVDDLSVSTKCQTIFGTLLDRLVELYNNAFLECFNEEEKSPDCDDIFHLTTALKRIFAFYSCNDLTNLDLWNSLFHIVSLTASPDETSSWPNIDAEVVALAISCCSNALLWRMQHLSAQDADQNDVKELKSKLDQYIKTCTVLLQNDSKRVSLEAYVSICDLLVVFSKHLISPQQPDQEVKQDLMDDLVYQADSELASALVNFVEHRVFIEPSEVEPRSGDDQADETADIEALHQKRTQLAAFCKLIMYNLIPIKTAAALYKHYIRSYDDFGDIMKSTLAKAREINRVHTARMVVLCLQLGYCEIEAADPNHIVERGSDGFQALKDLSRRLNLTFGVDTIKIREAMVAFHTEGIGFCTRAAANAAADNGGVAGVPPNLLFLEIVAEFSNKLLRQDKRSISEYVNNVFPRPRGEIWQSLHMYKASLDPDSIDDHQVQANVSQVFAKSGMSSTSTGSSGHKRVPRDSDSLYQPSGCVKRRRTNDSGLNSIPESSIVTRQRHQSTSSNNR